MPEEKDNIRSEKVQEIIGFIPHWIVRWGIGVIFVTVVIILAGSWFVQYPDIITASIVVTTENPPAVIVARQSGKIDSLFVTDNQQVKEGEHMALIENTANYQDVCRLKQKIENLKRNGTFIPADKFDFKQNFILGDIQSAYSNLVTALKEYQVFREMSYHSKKIRFTEKLILKHRELLNQQIKQQIILEDELQLIYKQYGRDSILVSRKLISERELEKSYEQMLQKKYICENSNSTAENIRIQINQLEETILDLELQKLEKEKLLQLKAEEALEKIRSDIANWEQNFLLISPIAGIVTFTKFWSRTQNVNTGEKILTVIPNETSNIVGKVSLPIQRSGKVEAGQEVHIKLSNFPYTEYGIVSGRVENISLVPEENSYMVEVSLPKNLTSSYGLDLEFNQYMQGTAEIVTENLRVLERILQPIRSLIK